MHCTQVLVLSECGFESWPVAALVSLSKTLDHNCAVLRMGRKAAGPVCCIMHVKEPRTLIVKEKGLAPVFLASRLEHPAGWICACYKSSKLLLLLVCSVVPDKCGMLNTYHGWGDGIIIIIIIKLVALHGEDDK